MMMRLVLNREVFSAALRSKTPARMTCRALFDFCTNQFFLTNQILQVLKSGFHMFDCMFLVIWFRFLVG